MSVLIPIPKIAVVDKISNPDEIVLTKGLLKDKFLIRINKMVKAIKDISTSNWVSPILLGLLLTYGVYSNQQSNTRLDEFKKESDKQHDLLIEMRAIKNQEEKDKAGEKEKVEREREMDAAWREDIKVRLKSMENMVLLVKR